MAEPFLGQIQPFAFSYPPMNWAFCAGQTMAIQQASALFSLIGVQFGGNGTQNFKLPNMVARQGCGNGNGPALSPWAIGQTAGTQTVALTIDQMPAHNHNLVDYIPGATTSLVAEPTTACAMGMAGNGSVQMFAPIGTTGTAMNPSMIMPAGGGQPHPNLQPFLGLNYSIALQGTFPSFN
ncbi:MAG: tail fiber protein [Pseudomonadota bacterium]